MTLVNLIEYNQEIYKNNHNNLKIISNHFIHLNINKMIINIKMKYMKNYFFFNIIKSMDHKQINLVCKAKSFLQIIKNFLKITKNVNINS